MATGLIGALRVTLGIDAADFESGTKGLQRRVKGLQKDFQTWGNNITSIGKVASVAITLPFIALLRTAIPAAKESRQALGQVEAALKSMGDGAGRTSAQLQEAAKHLELSSLYDDDDILRKVTANLLTFGTVAKDQFDRAQQAAVDLSARLGTDLQQSTIMVGKALNDPIKGLGALRRVGIQFTKQQQDQIKAMVKANNTVGAQKIMLSELERQFGGSAAAMRKNDPAAALAQSWRTFQEVVGELALKVLPPLISGLQSVLDKFMSLDPSVQTFIAGALAIGAAIGPIMLVVGPMVKAFGLLIPLIAGIGEASAAASAGTFSLGASLTPLLIPLGAIAAAVGAAYLAWKNWDKIAPALAAVGAAINAALGPTVRQMITDIGASLNELWTGPFGDVMRVVIQGLMELMKVQLAVFGVGAVTVIKGFASAVGSAFRVIADLLNAAASLLKGDFSGAWSYALKAASDAFGGIGKMIAGMVPGALQWVQRLYEGVRDWIANKLGSVLNGVKEKISAVTGWFRDMYVAVVGKSFVPDMVDAIGQHMARLNQEMEAPVQKSTAAVKTHFKTTADRIEYETKRAADAAKKNAQAIKEAYRDMVESVTAILERLYPEQTAQNQFNKEIDQLTVGMKKMGFTADETFAALFRLRMEFGKQQDANFQKSEVNLGPDADNPLVPSKDGMEEIAKWNENVLNEIGDLTKNKTVEMAKAWAEMARDAVSSLKGMVESFKSGDILGGIEKLLDLIVQVIGAIGGIRGGSTATYNRSSGAASGKGGIGFAGGGAFTVGGSGGVDSQMVRFRATPGEKVRITKGEQEGRYSSPSFSFDLRGAVMTQDLLNQMNAIGNDSARRGAVGGASLAAHQMRRARKGALVG